MALTDADTGKDCSRKTLPNAVGPHRTVNVLATDETCALAGFIVVVRSERPQRRLDRYWCRDTEATAGSCDSLVLSWHGRRRRLRVGYLGTCRYSDDDGRCRARSSFKHGSTALDKVVLERPSSTNLVVSAGAGVVGGLVGGTAARSSRLAFHSESRLLRPAIAKAVNAGARFRVQVRSENLARYFLGAAASAVAKPDVKSVAKVVESSLDWVRVAAT